MTTQRGVIAPAGVIIADPPTQQRQRHKALQVMWNNKVANMYHDVRIRYGVILSDPIHPTTTTEVPRRQHSCHGVIISDPPHERIHCALAVMVFVLPCLV